MERGLMHLGAEALISASQQLLGQRVFSVGRQYALAAREADPNRPEPNQIIAVADILIAAEKQLEGNHFDYYSILGVTAQEYDSGPGTSARIKKRVISLNPKENKFPFCMEALELVLDAWSFLSDPEKKQKCDSETRGQDHEHVPDSGSGSGTQNDDPTKVESFWTVCPYCYHLYQYRKAYKDCCLRCQNCRLAFQAVEAPPLSEGAIVEGRDEYYCTYGVLGNMDSWSRFFGAKEDGENPNEGGDAHNGNDSDRRKSEKGRAPKSESEGTKWKRSVDDPVGNQRMNVGGNEVVRQAAEEESREGAEDREGRK